METEAIILAIDKAKGTGIIKGYKRQNGGNKENIKALEQANRSLKEKIYSLKEEVAR